MSVETEQNCVDFDETDDSGDEYKAPVNKKPKKTKQQSDEWLRLGYKKPDYAEDRAKERELTAVATRGVTQLFNAVAERQTTVERKLEDINKTKQRARKVEILDQLKSNDFHSRLYRVPQNASDAKLEPKEEDASDAGESD